jgi:hypothetical protein
MRHLAGSSASCRRAVGLMLSRYDVVGSLRFGFRPDCRQPLPNRVTSELPVILSQSATANRERQGALTESRTTIAGDPFYREWLCGAGQGCRGRILERLYIDNCLPLTVELFRQLAFFILSCKPISYCRFKRIDVYIL